MFLTIFSAIPMSLTGIYLKFSWMRSLFSFVDGNILRVVHNQLSPIFSFSLIIMMLTGLVLYFYPILSKKK